MKVKEMRGFTTEELEAKMLEVKAELAKEKGSISSGTKAENPGKIRNLRRTIARILTVIKEKQIQKEKEKKTKTKKEVKKTK
ncbi:MAG: 50S ribosomal protein L29 [Candidatus Diapherotrites archaeon]